MIKDYHCGKLDVVIQVEGCTVLAGLGLRGAMFIRAGLRLDFVK